jgi:hypothetical protein
MFCPKCGGEAFEEQRFCKLCGTDLRLINNALKGGESGQNFFGLDLEALGQNAAEFARSWKSGWHGSGAGPESQRQRSASQIRREARNEIRNRIREQNLPKPKEWLSYSWQHNLRNGLISLFGGAATAFVLYYLADVAISEGVLDRLQQATQGRVTGLEPVVRIIWLFALIPVLKGLAQVIYAAFFAESIATLSDRFTVKLPPKPARVEQAASPNHENHEKPNHEHLAEEPVSVTENTTRFFEESEKSRVPRQSQ